MKGLLTTSSAVFVIAATIGVPNSPAWGCDTNGTCSTAGTVYYCDNAPGVIPSSPTVSANDVCPGKCSISGTVCVNDAGCPLGQSCHEGAGNTDGVVVICGTAGDDVINGSNTAGNADVLCGFGGKDTINGKAGPNTIDGGDSDDTLTGGSGIDYSYGGEGADTLKGGSGNDTLDGGNGDDNILGEAGNDTIYGGPYTGSGNNFIDGGTGDDGISGERGNDTLLGGDGNDQLYGYGGRDSMKGGNGNDSLVSGPLVASADSVMGSLYCGGAGDDIITAWGPGHQCLDAGPQTPGFAGGSAVIFGQTIYYDCWAAYLAEGNPPAEDHDVQTLRNCATPFPGGPINGTVPCGCD